MLGAAVQRGESAGAKEMPSWPPAHRASDLATWLGTSNQSADARAAGGDQPLVVRFDGRMTDWATISSLATAGGTLVLAVATFAPVRSANRAARVAELALQEGRRPVLMQSRSDDREQEIMFVDGYWVRVPGSGAVADHAGDNIYLALSVRNVGAGIGVLQSWHVRPAW